MREDATPGPALDVPSSMEQTLKSASILKRMNPDANMPRFDLV